MRAWIEKKHLGNILRGKVLTGVLVASGLLFSSKAWVKVPEIDELVLENVEAQEEVHKELSQQEGWKANSPKTVIPEAVTLAPSAPDYDPKTPKSLLTFQKEKTKQAPLIKKQFKRVAEEINQSEGL